MAQKLLNAQDGSVQFYNPLVPSGTEIQSWVAIQNYQAGRTQPALHFLKKGHSYDLTANLEAVPTGSVFLKVSFLDRYDNEIKQLIEKGTHMNLCLPSRGLYLSYFSLECWGQRAGFLQLKTGRNRRRTCLKQLNPILPVKEILKEINGLPMNGWFEQP
mgnify:CR=1 FL=1